jgi:hypothetical protein
MVVVTGTLAQSDPEQISPNVPGMTRVYFLEARLIIGWGGDIIDKESMVNVITYSSAKARMRSPTSREGLG